MSHFYWRENKYICLIDEIKKFPDVYQAGRKRNSLSRFFFHKTNENETTDKKSHARWTKRLANSTWMISARNYFKAIINKTFAREKSTFAALLYVRKKNIFFSLCSTFDDFENVSNDRKSFRWFLESKLMAYRKRKVESLCYFFLAIERWERLNIETTTSLQLREIYSAESEKNFHARDNCTRKRQCKRKKRKHVLKPDLGQKSIIIWCFSLALGTGVLDC